MIVAFDADVIIYSAEAGSPLGVPVANLLGRLDAAPDSEAIGSVLLLPEVLAKPMRLDPESVETDRLARSLSRVTLCPVSLDLAKHAQALAARYSLRAADAVHLATAVMAGADAFITNNRKDFPKTIAEVAIWYPEDLPEPGHLLGQTA